MARRWGRRGGAGVVEGVARAPARRGGQGAGRSRCVRCLDEEYGATVEVVEVVWLGGEESPPLAVDEPTTGARSPATRGCWHVDEWIWRERYPGWRLEFAV